MADRQLLVRIIGDDKSLQQAFVRSERGAKVFQSRMDSVNQATRGALSGAGSRSSLLFGSGAFLGTASLTAFTRKAVQSASDLEEQMNKVRVVFEEAGVSVQEWSQGTATELGISQRAALAAAGTFGNLFTVMDLAPAKSAEMSQALVKLAADLASFNNASPEDVLTAIRSGLIGEAEPLRRYGVLLSEARVQQVALANTGKQNIKALTDQEKALARYEIILQDTATAQGDFARTSDGMANQSRILRANLDDLSASIGSTLLPFLNSLTQGANKGIEALGGLADAAAGLGGEGFSEANANFDQLVARVADIQNLRASFVGPEVEQLGQQIKLVGDELNRIGATQKLISAFREASSQIDAALQDGVITPLEAAQLETEALGRIFLTVVPEGVLTGLGSQIRSGLEDATATARVGVQDLAVEIRSGIEDMSREAAVAARAGGEGVGDAFAEGLQAAAGRLSGQLAGLGEQALRARIAGDTSGELAALERQEENLRRQIAIQERIRAKGGRGAGTATKKLRQDLLPQLASVVAEQARITAAAQREEEAAVVKETEGTKRIISKTQESNREKQRLAAERKKGDQFEKLGLTRSGGQRVPGVGALRRRLGSLRDQVKGTVLDTAQTESQLDAIESVLVGKFPKVGREVRQAILDMFNQIASGFQEGEKGLTGDRGSGEITRGGIRSTQRLLRGLDLSEEEKRIIQQRNLGRTGRRGLSAFGFGIGQPSTFGTGAGVGAGATGGIIIQNLTVVTNDPNDMLKKLQKKARRSAGGRRGRHGGANLGAQ